LAAAVVLGVVLPLMMAPATKSSPLFLAVAAALASAALGALIGLSALAERLRKALMQPASVTALLLLALVIGGIPFAHAPRASLLQFAQFAGVAVSGLLLAACLPDVAPRKRALLFAGGFIAAAALMAADLNTGLWLRSLTGGRETTYTYNRGLVTLVLLAWPLLALILSARKMWLAAPVVILLPLAILSGESAAAVVALATGAAVFPVAALLPRLTRWIGLGAMLALLAVQPWFGTIMQTVLTGAFHDRFKGAHSSDRVDIWLSFEAAARAKWLVGSGFGSSANLQNAPVAALVPPDRVTLLGASHPHNAFLQVWVELGLAGAALTAALIVLLFLGIGRMRPALQPFALTCVAISALVALVSHGAWQPWWWAAIAACIAHFATLEHELRRAQPPA
jgi:exopolysaccharide production protein ExoQ